MCYIFTLEILLDLIVEGNIQIVKDILESPQSILRNSDKVDFQLYKDILFLLIPTPAIFVKFVERFPSYFIDGEDWTHPECLNHLGIIWEDLFFLIKELDPYLFIFSVNIIKRELLRIKLIYRSSKKLLKKTEEYQRLENAIQNRSLTKKEEKRLLKYRKEQKQPGGLNALDVFYNENDLANLKNYIKIQFRYLRQWESRILINTNSYRRLLGWSDSQVCTDLGLKLFRMTFLFEKLSFCNKTTV